jgi:hypothetical protein
MDPALANERRAAESISIHGTGDALENDVPNRCFEERRQLAEPESC